MTGIAEKLSSVGYSTVATGKVSGRVLTLTQPLSCAHPAPDSQHHSGMWGWQPKTTLPMGVGSTKASRTCPPRTTTGPISVRNLFAFFLWGCRCSENTYHGIMRAACGAKGNAISQGFCAQDVLYTDLWSDTEPAWNLNNSWGCRTGNESG